jgi:hypothetical protein
MFWNFFVQLLQEPDKVTLICAHDSDLRVVRLNPHAATPIFARGFGGALRKAIRWASTPWDRSGRIERSIASVRPRQALHVVERYLLDYESHQASARTGRNECKTEDSAGFFHGLQG